MTEAVTTAGRKQPQEREQREPGRSGRSAVLLSPARSKVLAFPQSHRGRRGAVPKVLLAAADLAAVGLGLGVISVAQPSADAGLLTVLSLPLWLGVLANHGVYKARNVQRFSVEVRSLLHAAALAMATTALAGLLLERYVSRRWLVFGFVAATATLIGERAVARAVFANLRRRGRMVRRVVAVGADVDGCELVELLTSQQRLGYQVLGFADDVLPTGALPVEGVPVLGTTDEVATLVKATGADGVLVSSSALDPARLNALARTLGDGGVHVELSNPLRSVAAERLTVRAVGTKFAVVHLEPPEGSRWRAFGKRAFDVVVASVGLVLAMPILLVSAVAIKIDSRGPVLFRQDRVGRDGVTFRVLKLRSMVADAEHRLEELRHLNEVQWPLFKVRRDPRTTRVGRVIRTLSVDELPQLWNVLRGEMSMVGPRPALPSEIHGWSPELHRRLRVRPGITGMWQVSCRANASFDDYVHLDLYYVDNWCLGMDVQILLRTVPSVLMQRGAH